jgi:tetrahydromethanopterin S-methyltransferase subunit A
MRATLVLAAAAAIGSCKAFNVGAVRMVAQPAQNAVANSRCILLPVVLAVSAL